MNYPAGVGPLERLTPRSSVRTRLLLAAATWTAVGLGLGIAGAIWSAATPWIVAGAIVLGLVKGRFVLAPRARANGDRILESGEGRCLGGAFTFPTWALVLAMMGLGALLRRSPLPRPWLGGIYLAVGVALLLGSVPVWSRWRSTGPPQTS